MPSPKIITSLFIAIIIFVNPVHATEITVRDDLLSLFDKYKTSGTFALYAPAEDRLTLVNPKRATTRMIPASTFKIANSLIALETGAIADENEIIPYDGTPQPIKTWEKDMPLKQAFKVSNVPVYQGLARRIGTDAYNIWLDRLGYGNQAVGDDVTMFWLKGPLKISAIEQAEFLSKLAGSELPFSDRTQQITRDIAKIETKGKRTLFGKTGWTTTPNPDLGWFVGWVESENSNISFALNMDINSRKDVRLREKIAREMLAELGLY